MSLLSNTKLKIIKLWFEILVLKYLEYFYQLEIEILSLKVLKVYSKKLLKI